jgi:hypothetical protein
VSYSFQPGGPPCSGCYATLAMSSTATYREHGRGGAVPRTAVD